MEKGKQLSVNFITQMVSFALNLAISFFLTPYVIEFIGKEVYGFVNLANSFTGYVVVFTTALNGMLSRYVTISYAKKDYDSASKYMSSVIITNIVIMLAVLPVCVFFAANLEHFINLPAGAETDIKIMFLFVFIGFCINLPGGCFFSATYAANRLDKANICSLLGSVIRISIIFGMLILMTPRVWYVGFASFINTLFLIVCYRRYMARFTPEIKLSAKHFSFGAVKELVGIGIWNSVNQLSQLLLTGLDLIIANLFVSVLSMNLLSYAKMIPTHLFGLLAAVAGVFAPIMTMAYGKGDKQEFINETNFAIKCCGFICSIPIIGLIVFGESFFGLWLKALTADEVHVVSILSALTVMPYVFNVYIHPLYTVNTITAKIRVPVIVTVCYSVVSIIIVYILVNVTNLEIYAVAGVSSVLTTLYVVFFSPNYAAHTLNVRRSTFYKPLIRGMVCNAVLFAIFFGIKSIFAINGWIQFFGVCGFAAIVGYAAAFFVLFSKEERKKTIVKARSLIGGRK